MQGWGGQLWFRVGLLFSAAVFAVLFLQGLDHLDRLFLPDDTYYTLSIARNIAEGQGPTTDGVILTSGFQPLVVALQVPAFWLSDGPEGPVRWAILLGAVFGLVTIALAGRIVARAGGGNAAVAGTMIFAASAPVVIANAFNGLETTLAMTCAMVLALKAAEIRESASAARLAGLGAICGIALLARIDTCFLVVAVGLLCWWRVGFLRSLIVAGAAVIVVAPWWTWCLLNFGTPIPESGRAVAQIVAYYREAGMTWQDATTSAIHVLSLVTYAMAGSLSGWIISIGAAACAVAVVVRAWRHRKPDALALLSVAAIALVVFYIAHLPIQWFFDRYFLPAYLVLIMSAAVMLSHLAARSRLAGIAGLMAGGVLIAFNIIPVARLHDAIAPEGWGVSHVTGYAPVAREILAQIPEGATLGAFQSGALGYFAAPDRRVVNLDGVVNGEAREAIGQDRLAEYMMANDVAYFADWPVNRDMLFHHSGSEHPERMLSPKIEFDRQRHRRFTLYRVNAETQ